MPTLDPDIRLLETMRVEGGRIALLGRHLERIARSAAHFGYTFDIIEIEDDIEAQVAAQSAPLIARLLVADGAHELQFRPLPPAGRPNVLRLSRLHAEPGDERLFHKTTARAFYDQARAGTSEEEDVLITNTRGEVTETTILNVAVLRDGVWVTPPVECGLLPGVMRAELLARGKIVEGIVRADELVDGETIRCFNAVRGVLDVTLRLR